jgi:hypothetical protein
MILASTLSNSIAFESEAVILIFSNGPNAFIVRCLAAGDDELRAAPGR